MRGFILTENQALGLIRKPAREQTIVKSPPEGPGSAIRMRDHPWAESR